MPPDLMIARAAGGRSSACHQGAHSIMSSEHLIRFGWDSFFVSHFQPFADKGFHAGRVILEYNNFLRVVTAEGERLAEIAGRLKHEAASRAELPSVGDWVALRLRGDGKATIHAVLPRRSRFARKMAGARTEAQVVGANIDTIFLVTSLNQDFNPRRVERFLTSLAESGASPVIILSKADLCADVVTRLAEMQQSAGDAPVHAVSVVTRQGLDELLPYLSAGRTVALIGSSGVGKSTLINQLIGSEVQQVRDIREHDDRGQHTTRHRQLFLLPQGGLMLDTPGMRELQLWDGDSGVQSTFEDIEAIAAHCHFSDCQHQREPRCAIRAAIEEGALAPERLGNYLKLQQELDHLARRQDEAARLNEKNKWKKLSRQARERAKAKRTG